jgi:hypothetical protein
VMPFYKTTPNLGMELIALGGILVVASVASFYTYPQLGNLTNGRAEGPGSRGTVQPRCDSHFRFGNCAHLPCPEFHRTIIRSCDHGNLGQSTGFAIANLASLVPGFSPELKYAVRRGGRGGGLTVIRGAGDPCRQWTRFSSPVSLMNPSSWTRDIWDIRVVFA